MSDDSKKSGTGYDSKLEVTWEMTKMIFHNLHSQKSPKAREEFQEIFAECLQTVIAAENNAFDSGRGNNAENDDLISKRK